ncbi:MAG: phosphotransferase [Planctomycetaceae bacterium]
MNPLFPIFERFGNRFAAIDSCESVGGGFSGAHVWKIESRSGSFAVRRWPSDAAPARIHALHRLLRHVASQDVPVPVPLPDRHGETLFPHGGRWWQVEPWLPGRADFRVFRSDARLSAAMKTLASFHRAAESFVSAVDDADWFGGPNFGPAPALRDREALLLRRVIGGERTRLAQFVPARPNGEFAELARRSLCVFERVGESVFAEVRRAGSIAVPLTPCLRDLWHDHVLFTGDEVSGLIDPAACRRDTVATDLSRLLGSLLGDDFSRWDRAIQEYSRHRPLSPGEISLVPVLDRSGLLLSAATWLRRRYLFHQPCETPEVIARLHETVTRLERL